MPVHHVPDGYHSVIPYLVIDGAARAMEFYRAAFGAVEVMRMPYPDGRIGHAEMKIGDAHIMLADEHPDEGHRGPKAFGGSAVSIMIYIADTDGAVAAAVERGATIVRPVETQFYGDRMGVITDPFGHVWNVATHVEDVSPEEMERRMKEQPDKG
ncbi:MAG: VOC family protein [Thermoanaerobaculia bacterium]